MNDDLSTAGSDDDTQDGPLDRYDDAVIAADATGMLAGERLITNAEIEEGLDGSDKG